MATVRAPMESVSVPAMVRLSSAPTPCGMRSRPAANEILERAIARGEIDPAGLTARVRTVAIDLMRHHMFLTFKPLSESDIVGIVDEIFLPLVRPSGCPPGAVPG